MDCLACNAAWDAVQTQQLIQARDIQSCAAAHLLLTHALWDTKDCPQLSSQKVIWTRGKQLLLQASVRNVCLM